MEACFPVKGGFQKFGSAMGALVRDEKRSLKKYNRILSEAWQQWQSTQFQLRSQRDDLESAVLSLGWDETLNVFGKSYQGGEVPGLLRAMHNLQDEHYQKLAEKHLPAKRSHTGHKPKRCRDRLGGVQSMIVTGDVSLLSNASKFVLHEEIQIPPRTIGKADAQHLLFTLFAELEVFLQQPFAQWCEELCTQRPLCPAAFEIHRPRFAV